MTLPVRGVLSRPGRRGAGHAGGGYGRGMSRTRRTALAGAALLCLLTAGCTGGGSDGGSDGGPDGPGSGSGEVEVTPQALAAAVLAHTDEDPVAVAPVFGDERLRPDDLAVELALDRPEGDNAHVRVVVSDRLPFRREDEDPCAGPWECRDVGVDGVDGTLLYEAGYPEEDPGSIVAWSVREEGVVWGYAYGPFVEPDDEGGPGAEAEALGELLAAVVTDPGVGPTTSAAYAEAGREVCAGGAWLRWYGDGNGAPRPEDFVDWCG